MLCVNVCHLEIARRYGAAIKNVTVGQMFCDVTPHVLWQRFTHRLLFSLAISDGLINLKLSPKDSRLLGDQVFKGELHLINDTFHGFRRRAKLRPAQACNL